MNEVDFDAVRARMEKDGKRNPRARSLDFALAVVVGLPLWVGILLPAAISTRAIGAIPSASRPKVSKDDDEPREEEEKENDDSLFPAKPVPLDQRKYDLVLLGATGFVGKLAAEHLVERYGVNENVKWALAGRSRSKLDDLKRNLAEKFGNQNVLKVDTIVVDTSVRSTLHALVKDTKSVASCAGPFDLYGSPVVEFCARYGTNYADVTAEIDWHRDMIASWADEAERTGAVIVSFCGHDSVPWDLSVHLLKRRLAKDVGNDDRLAEVSFLDETESGGPSGGTVASALAAIDGDGGDSKKQPRYAFDPLRRTADGTESARSFQSKSLFRPRRRDDGRWEGPFVMSPVNAEVVRRSHVLSSSLNDDDLVYEETLLSSDFKTAFLRWFQLAFGITVMFLPRVVRDKLVPKPGEGPSRETMEKGYLTVRGRGKSIKGSRVESVIYFPREAGYLDTSRMLVESGLCLALDVERLPVAKGGFYTAATAMGDVLLDRLSRHGTMFASRSLVEDNDDDDYNANRKKTL